MIIDGTRIWKTLYQGGTPIEGSRLCKNDFNILVLMAEEIQPEAWKFPGIHVIRLPMRDEPTLLTPQQIGLVRGVSRELARHLTFGRKVLVTCRAGLNRSGLMVAATLLRASAMSPVEAIQTIRRHRSAKALSNPAFVHAIVTEMRHDHDRPSI